MACTRRTAPVAPRSRSASFRGGGLSNARSRTAAIALAREALEINRDALPADDLEVLRAESFLQVLQRPTDGSQP